MINAQDLMLGSRVLYAASSESPELNEVSICAFDISLCISSPDRFYPIPLTEDILIKRCGLNAGESVESGVSLSTGEAFTMVRKFHPKGGWLLCYKGLQLPISSLHEFQRAFLVLFKRELEIK